MVTSKAEKKPPIRPIKEKAKENKHQDRTGIQQELEIYKLIFESIYNGCMVTDENGYITHFNGPYGQFLGLEPAKQIGKHCTEVIENTRMHIVAKSGKPEINHSQKIKGQNMVVQRIPIKKNGEVIAVFGQVMFKDIRDVRKLAEKLSLLETKVELYEKELYSLRSTYYTLDSIVGVSNCVQVLKRDALRAAGLNFPVLITGESGTGKELFAHAIHNASNRRLHPFIRINCSAIPKDLLESELFGYEKGAFTGASSNGKPGKFELAHHGTMFLDEISDLPIEMQPKLLRVLEEKELERIGGNSLIRTDFRLVAATNQNLEQMLEEGKFRQDLFYRLNVIPIHIPPLRERQEDIMPLAEHLLKQICQEASIPEKKIDLQSQEALKNYNWPGNVRELSNVIGRVLSYLEKDTIHLCDLPFYLYSKHKNHNSSNYSSLKNLQAGAEKDAIRSALESTDYNKSQAANLLGIHRTLLYKKMKKYNLSLNQEVAHT